MSTKPKQPKGKPLPVIAANSEQQACVNTDRELWREREGDFYADSIHVTENGAIGINCGGHVFVKPIREWHRLAKSAQTGSEHLPDSLQDWIDKGNSKHTGHTPGPWSYSGISGDNYIMAKQGNSRIAVAEVIMDEANGLPISLEEFDANKELIARAPQLLAERNQLLDALKELLRYNTAQTPTASILKAERAIAALGLLPHETNALSEPTDAGKGQS